MEAVQTPINLEALFKDASDDLARYFSRRHGGSGDASQDLVQETFAELARGLEEGRRPRSPRAYLFGIARNVSLAAWRRRYLEREWLATDVATETVAAPSPDERVAVAVETIAALPDLQREILDLRFSQQLSYAEIAEALDIPVGTVRSRLHHAIRAVRKRIESDEPESSNF
ncbi:MAG: RNA polymerase sigma factor [Verrucomicrobiae bacterium]|nr:RNA polymerase sigma factor [Verrucomicrobiae bacterium]MCB1091645.1 RNA polymerase sigma factor [Verrucomicrobiae bacterium]